ncbi:unnamed protein product [Clonostachys chloroleuca]|uniref:Ysc84 actin-binding domain-containing protein n=1 Tax=Clonostachys chloroleuca TaxID=1926264 RepID=A0AA35PXH0_9HYPO|nr:unnamed protein product [Clonostachys chloroleuca]
MTATVYYTDKPTSDKAGSENREDTPVYTEEQPSQTQERQPPAYSDDPAMYAAQEPQPIPEKDIAKRRTLRERLHKITIATGKPVNKLTNIIGSEGWWPTSVEDECVKAARILHSFTNLDSSSQPPNSNGPKHPTGLTRKSMVKIPPKVLHNAAGLAIFNTARVGAWHGSLAGGSGLVTARRPDGTWSPPSAFVVTTIGAGFMFGLDVYDCVCVLNTPAQVAAFTKPQVALGGNFGVSLGPVGSGSAVNAAVTNPGRPAWSYIKSRGIWAGVQVDGTVIVSRADANAVFYEERGITAQRILQGDVAWPMGSRPLFEVLKALEDGRGYAPSVVEEGAAIPPPARDMPIMDEKQAVMPEVKVTDTEEREQVPAYSDKDEELYASSLADEKERLAKADEKPAQ